MTNFRARIALVATSAAVVAGAGGLIFRDTLTINGKPSTVDVRQINGSAYVRLADVARALDMTVVSHGAGRYELTKAGGANAIGAMSGKVGDTIFDGRWRFTVLSVEEPETYQMKTDAEPYDYSGRTAMNSVTRLITPSKGYRLVVLKVRLANGVKERRTLWTAPSDSRIRTAIADSEGSSHPPVAYDFKGGPTQTEWLLPGAQMTFSIVFGVPTDAKIKDLVMSLKNNQTDEPAKDVRVSLATP